MHPISRIGRPRPAPATHADPLPAPARVWTLLSCDLAGPPLCGLQAQGDVIVIPWPALVEGRPLPGRGVVVLAGRRGRSGHLLLPAAPTALWAPAPGPLTLGALHVPEDAWAVLSHDDHLDLRIGPGSYVLRRQRVLPTPGPHVSSAGFDFSTD